MGQKYKEINKINEIRKKITQITELMSLGKKAKESFAKRPGFYILGMVLLGFFTAIFSGSIIRLILSLISFGFRVMAFIVVTQQSFDKVSGFLKKVRKQDK